MMDKAGNLAMKRIIDKRRIHYRREHDGNNKHDWWRQPWDESEVEGLHITMDDFEVCFAVCTMNNTCPLTMIIHPL